MKKFGSGTRATFVSPYLRRPLRPLDKVLSEREDRSDETGSPDAVNDTASEYGSTTWGMGRKAATFSD